MTSFHHFKSIFNSSFQFYGLSQWLLEPMPNNVDLNPYNIRRGNNGWIFHRHNARSKFICMFCPNTNKHRKIASGWSSAYTTILFRARFDRSSHGQQIGRIQMKIFEQGCQTCNMYSMGIFEEKEIKKIFYWLYIWILKTFYHIRPADHVDNNQEFFDRKQIENRSQYPHDSSRCDGCRIGWCKYGQRKRTNVKSMSAFFP